MADDRLTSALEDARERIDVAPYGTVIATARSLLAAVDAVLKAAGEWEAESTRLDAQAGRAPGTHLAASMSSRAQAGTDHAAALRDVIARELAGEEASGG